MRAVSSFKVQFGQPRAPTPPKPPYEPLSPANSPVPEPPERRQGPAHAHDAHDAAPTEHVYGPAPMPAAMPALPALPVLPVLPVHMPTQPSPARASPAPRPSELMPHFSPQQASPTDALAGPAASTLEASPAFLHAVPRYPASERAVKHAYPEGASYGERPSKRARSEFVPSPRHAQHHSRPATSHTPRWAYNVEQMVDDGVRMYQGSFAPARSPLDSPSKRLSDAQLLLDFRNAVSTPQSARPYPPSAAGWSPARPEASDHRAVRTAAEKPDPPTLRDPTPLNPVREHGLDQGAVYPAVQTHTPPEEAVAAAAPQAVQAGSHGDEKKLKKHQGWPKGKPRGPRAGSAADKKKKAMPKQVNFHSLATVAPLVPDQLHSPQSLPAESHDAPPQDDLHLSVAPAPIPEQLPRQVLEPSPRASALQSRRLSYSSTSLQRPEAVPAFPRAQSVPCHATSTMAPTPFSAEASHVATDRPSEVSQMTICSGCDSSDSVTSIGDGEQWISCDGCKGWFHYSCAGFKTEREVRAIDRFYCDGCKPNFGSTTKVRKSSRAHTAVDYAGLNEGIMKTSDDNPEHHYIQAFKNGNLKFTPEAFARIPPECATADFFEKMNGFTEPVMIPAALNPRPKPSHSDPSIPQSPNDPMTKDDPDEPSYGYELAPDDGQDKLDMVIPDGLTVRRVAELYGPAELVPVIDVKAQEGEDEKKWNLAKWADYYEQEGEKPVRNVISLEVSKSKLGRLIRRPKVVRDMDLQDSVWPEDDHYQAPAVQFYCLMSVADCYTDFHIDFGGSSVYYHIVKGRKTFFFIPPTKSNLKKYEDWCDSPGQSHEFLGLQVKECYRVDLYPGDTMLIPSGWIHAVWTPEDSLVIGGNYLTRIHYGMQLKVLEIEKNTKVALKFRYPFFQKIMWLAVIKYLEEDPLPPSVEDLLLSGGQFDRETPIYCEPDKFGHNSDLGPENYNRRYYPKAELEGLVDLKMYIWRTVMISQGRVEGITKMTQNAVTRSIPKGHGEPLLLARRFAMWVAWKRGKETIPEWAHPDASLPDATKLTAHAKKMERELWNETLKLVRGGERHSSLRARVSEPTQNGEARVQAGPPVTGFLRPHREYVTTPKTSQLGPKRIACDACRRRRIRCKHKDELVESPISSASGGGHANMVSSSSPPTTSMGMGDSAARRYSDADIPSASLPYSSLYDQGNMNSGPVMVDLNAESLANKSGRVKACADCRKSKRRCVHDEHGNVDPVKAAEAPVPRGSATKKRRASEEDDGEALTKKMKMDSFAGLVNGEVSHWNRYPLQKPRPASASGSAENMAMDSGSGETDHMEGEDPMGTDRLSNQLLNGNGHRDDDHVDMLSIDNLSHPYSGETVVSSIEDETGDHMEGIEMDDTGPQPPTPSPRTPAPTANMLHNDNDEPNGVLSASPPSPPTARSVVSTSLRRGSTARNWPQTSKASVRSWSGKSTTPKATPARKYHQHSSKESTIKLEPRSDHRPRSVTVSSAKEERSEEDMASLALALQLQAEERGLRRRGNK